MYLKRLLHIRYSEVLLSQVIIPLSITCLLNSVANGNTCNHSTGPVGAYSCISIPRYQGDQYANCLSNAYIQRKSSGKHTCEEPSAVYCWHQCMIENHNANSGPVASDCLCNNDSSAVSIQKPLAPECHSPDGTDCNWYKNCLDEKYPCGSTGHATQYAEKFCNLYTNNYGWFSLSGQPWIDGVRRCLQVALVPLIRPYSSATCAQIQQQAFDSHTNCYLTPGFRAPSICELSCSDWLKVFWTIKSSFLTSAAFQSLARAVQVAWNCKTAVARCSLSSGSGTGIGRMSALSLKASARETNRVKRELNVLEGVNKYELAAKVTDRIASQLNWNHDRMDWFGFILEDKFVDVDDVLVNIWIINKINVTGNEDLVQNEANRFQEWISSGKNYLVVEVNGISFKPVTLSVCESTACDKFNATVVAGPPTDSANGKVGFALWSFISVILIIINFYN